MLKKYRQGLFSVIVALGFAAPASVQAQNTDIEQIKAALLDDPLFLSHLRDRLSVETLDDSHIRTVVRAYLLDNPDLLIEMQQVLMARNEAAVSQSQEEAKRIIAENLVPLFENDQDMILGNPQGDIKIVEFYDYNCGYCKSSYPNMLALLEEDKNLSLVMKDFPILGEDSGRAHLIARALKKIAPEHYPDFHHQMMVREGRADEANTIELALSFGVNKQQLLDAMIQEEIQMPLIDNAKIAYQLGFNFTPAYIIGDEIIRGATDNNHMAAVVKQQRQSRQ